MGRSGSIPLGAGAPRLFKNYLINGNLDFWQRGTSFLNSGGALVRGTDRWNFWVGAAMASTMSQQSAQSGYGYALRIQRNAGVTATTNIQVTQHIDLTQVAYLAGKKVTLSFLVRKGANFSSSNFKVQVTTGTAAVETNLITSGFTGRVDQELSLASVTTSQQRLSVTVTIPYNALQMAINFYADTFSGTAGANDWFEIEKIMLNEGNFVAPFKTHGESPELELIACQRYYEKSYAIEISPGTAILNDAHAFTTHAAVSSPTTTVYFKVIKRASSTMTGYNPVTGALNQFYLEDGSVAPLTFSPIGNGKVRVYPNVATIAANEHLHLHWTADAEL